MRVNVRRYARGSFPAKVAAAREATSLLLTETRYAAHSSLERHDHELPCIVVLFDGSFTEELEGGGRRICTAPFVILRPARERHSNLFGAGGARVLNIELSEPWVERARERVPEQSSVVERLAQERLATELLRAFRLPSSGQPSPVSALVARTLAASAAPCPGRVPSAPVELARELAERRFREPWALGEIAEEVGLHPVSLARAFRRAHGESFGAFVRRLRVREAYRLLAGGSAPVADVAQAAGFFDQAHLARVFRAFVGVSPGQLRDLARTSPDARES